MTLFKSVKTEKRNLFLGGAYFQTPVLRYARKEGFYVILCDYLENNPGRFLANEYHSISTTDKKEILSLAKMKEIDAIVAYGSEPAMPAASYVANELGIVGNPNESVRILIEKHKFRKYLVTHSFNAPKFCVFQNF